jgi:hypothetical protein
LQVVQIDGKGRGVVATRPFSRGDFVVEYAGRLLDDKKARNKERMYAEDSDVGCYMFFFEHRNEKLWYVNCVSPLGLQCEVNMKYLLSQRVASINKHSNNYTLNSRFNPPIHIIISCAHKVTLK